MVLVRSAMTCSLPWPGMPNTLIDPGDSHLDGWTGAARHPSLDTYRRPESHLVLIQDSIPGGLPVDYSLSLLAELGLLLL